MIDAPYVRLEVVAPPSAARFKHLEGFSRDYKLLKGRLLWEEFPADAVYRMNPNFPDDIALEDAAYNLDNQLVVNGRLRAFLEAQSVPDLEFLPVALVNHKGRTEKEPYAIVNLLRHVDAVDKDATEHTWNALDDTAMIGVKNLTVDAERVPDDAVLFRLVHMTDVIAVRRDLAEALSAEGFTGLAFTAFSDYNG